MIEGLQTTYHCIYCRSKLPLPSYIREATQITTASVVMTCICNCYYTLDAGIPEFFISHIEINIKDNIYFKLYVRLKMSEIIKASPWSSGQSKCLAVVQTDKFIGLTIEEIRTKVLKLMAFI